MNDITQINFEYVRNLVYRGSAISIDSDMSYLVQSRMTSLVRKEGLTSLDELFSKLRSGVDPSLTTRVVEAMTTNETSFFRDSHPFEVLCQELLPKQAAAHSGTLNIWSAACSTGQEPYSIAMAVSENCPQLIPRLRIHATDLSTDALNKARTGLYNRLEVNRGLPIQLLSKYFEQQGLHWQVCSEIRDLVEFEVLNLAKEWTCLPRMDVIFLRNVLIYFDPEVKSSVLQKSVPVLKPDGCLFLGASETTSKLDTTYQRVPTERSCYYNIA